MARILTVTGYKPHELGIFSSSHEAVDYIKKAFLKELHNLAEDGLEWVIVSGQLGAELWAAESVFELQEAFPDVQLAVITPFLNQEENWNEHNKELYEMVVSQADFVDSITKRNYESPQQFRLKNDFLVAKSDAVLLLYDEEKEGSPKFFLEAAKKAQQNKDLKITQITFHDLQVIVEEEQLKDW
ncbi:DUF1273 family protein [Bacillus lacus]|uniref:UPF0398 protein GJU40_02015 n=1 Tax=Metabacillus lacus TaxID=1983721 RepID=A0A7X2LYJ2_9BACI|nr:DUF1273 domain-containing protein [Metabacillus lacus]MRX70942.1 DUF1273 family protein [Metabacillus lacus]